MLSKHGDGVDRVAATRVDLEVRPGDGDPVDPYSALAARGIAP